MSTDKLKYYVIVEKMASAIFGNLGFPDTKTRLAAAFRRYREIISLIDILQVKTAYLWIDTTLHT